MVKPWTMLVLWLPILCWITTVYAQLPILLAANQHYSFRSPLPSPVLPGEVLRNWLGTGQTKLTKKDNIDTVQLTDMEQDGFGTLYHLTPFTHNHFNLSFVYWIETQEFEPREDSLAFWYTKHPPSYGPVYGNEVAFQGFGLVIQLFDSQLHGPSLSAVINEQVNGGNQWKVKTLSPGCSLGSLTGKVYLSYDQGKLSVYQLPIQKKTRRKPQLCFQATIPVAAQVESGYLGFTARSERYATEHDIIQLTVASQANAATTTTTTTENKQKQADPVSSSSDHVGAAAKTASSNSHETSQKQQQQTPPKDEISKTEPQVAQSTSKRIESTQPALQEEPTTSDMEYLKNIWNDNNERQLQVIAKLTQLVVEWQSVKRSTFITMIFAITLVVLLQLYACILFFYYRKLAGRLRYNKII